MQTADHTQAFEELMAYLDGELDPAAADRVRRHASTCEQCARMAETLRDTSSRMASWAIEAAPRFPAAKPTVKPASSRWTLWHYTGLAAAACLVLVVGATSMRQQETEPRRRELQRTASTSVAGRGGQQDMAGAVPETVAAPAAQVQPQSAADMPVAGPLVIRTAELVVIPRTFDGARGDVEKIVSSTGGFVADIAVSAILREGRSLSATLRIPASRLDDALGQLRALGTVMHESQTGEDVTRQSADLDARLANARASEARLKTILAERTGRLAEVLDVEREISRVRGEIEAMEAERKGLDGRIAYASVRVRMTEERKAALDLGPLPIPVRFRNAFIDGWANAFALVLALGLFATEWLPMALVFGLVMAPPAVFVVRRRRKK